MKTNVFGKGAAVSVRLTAGLGLGILVGIVATCSIILTQRAMALSQFGPDAADFATNQAWYMVSNTKDVSGSTRTGLTVFRAGPKPTTNISIFMTAQGCPCQGSNLASQGTGQATFVIQGGATYGPFKGGDGTRTLTLKPTDGWVAQGNGYTLHMDVYLVNLTQSADNSNHFNFKMNANTGNIIGPDGNYRFTMTQGPGIYCTNSTGSCAPTYTYREPFAPDCTVTTPQVKQVKLHDVDQGNAYIQPQHMGIAVRDTTTGTNVAMNQYVAGGPLNETGSEANGQDALFTFTAQPGHKYQMLLTQVNGNNVLQMFLPYDAINAQVDCRPVGAIVPSATNGCSALQGWIYDNNNTSLKLTYYVLVNSGAPAASYPASTPAGNVAFAGPFTANLASPTSPVGGGHGFKVNIPADVAAHNYKGPWLANSYNIYAKDPYNTNLYKVASFTQPACATLTCGSSTFAPTLASAPIAFTVSMNTTAYATLPLPDADFTVTVSGPGGTTTYPSVPATLNAGPPTISSSTMTYTPLAPGTYTATWVYNGITCTDTGNKVGYEPYFNVIGGDISAGNGFDDGGSCAGNDNAEIKGWNQDTAALNTYGGSNAGLAAFATANNGIAHFVTGSASTVSLAAAQGHRLSFANYSAGAYVTPPIYGDSYGTAADLPCVHDYQADAPAASRASIGLLPNQITNAELTAAAFAGGDYAPDPGDITLGDGSPITLVGGKQTTLYIDGDVYITSNILYSYAQLTDIPQFRLVVSGGIYLAPNVTEIHGLYVAQNNGGPTGIFATCASGVGAPISDYATCNQHLTVIGAVAAEGQVLLGRTHSSVVPDPPIINVAEPAETFQYSPELWLNPSYSVSASGPLTYQAFTGLPPVL